MSCYLSFAHFFSIKTYQFDVKLMKTINCRIVKVQTLILEYLIKQLSARRTQSDLFSNFT